jgi:hypothetical protein|nr:hypothetical protein Q903MT_gene6263 [Picea sitchensis]
MGSSTNYTYKTYWTCPGGKFASAKVAYGDGIFSYENLAPYSRIVISLNQPAISHQEYCHLIPFLYVRKDGIF